jgi:hypothetical protein
MTTPNVQTLDLDNIGVEIITDGEMYGISIVSDLFSNTSCFTFDQLEKLSGWLNTYVSQQKRSSAIQDFIKEIQSRPIRHELSPEDAYRVIDYIRENKIAADEEECGMHWWSETYTLGDTVYEVGGPIGGSWELVERIEYR